MSCFRTLPAILLSDSFHHNKQHSFYNLLYIWILFQAVILISDLFLFFSLLSTTQFRWAPHWPGCTVRTHQRRRSRAAGRLWPPPLGRGHRCECAGNSHHPPAPLPGPRTPPWTGRSRSAPSPAGKAKPGGRRRISKKEILLRFDGSLTERGRHSCWCVTPFPNIKSFNQKEQKQSEEWLRDCFFIIPFLSVGHAVLLRQFASPLNSYADSILHAYSLGERRWSWNLQCGTTL